MMNDERKKETLLIELVKVSDKLDVDLMELGYLDGSSSIKNSLKKWYAKKKAIHEIKKLVHKVNKYEKEIERYEKQFENVDTWS
ncbi:MAG: hypothetical protein KC455_06625 [Carnobacterium sp.]|nr:hypothetical protein [Carnobacterium sp.]